MAPGPLSTTTAARPLVITLRYVRLRALRQPPISIVTVRIDAEVDRPDCVPRW
jgi:hypothetical protein